MTGDSQDMLARLKSVLPTRWFADETPVLDALLAGLSAAWACVYAQLAFLRLQSRLATATDAWLDAISNDFFATRLARRPAEADDPYRARIQRELLRPRGTRAALASILTDLTGRAPTIFEPARPADTGAWALAAAYGAANASIAGHGAWGSLNLPFQCFVTAYRPAPAGIAILAGYGTGGPSAYASLAMVQGRITDADIDAAIASVLPTATIAWTRITDAAPA